MSSNFIQVGPLSEGKFAEMVVAVDASTGLPMTGLSAGSGGGTASTTSTTATLTTVTATTTSAIVLPANPARKAARLVNNSTAIFYGRYGIEAASDTAYSFALAPLTASPIVPAGIPSYEEIPAGYTGPITGVWAGGSGALLVTEFSLWEQLTI